MVEKGQLILYPTFMEDFYSKEKLFERVYNYSKRYLPYKLLSRLGLGNVFPQKASEFLVIFGLNSSFAGLVYLLALLLEKSIDKSPLYITGLIMVVISAVLTGLHSALLTSTLIFFEVYLLTNFSKTELDLSLYIQLTFFISGAIIVSYLIDLTRGNGEVKRLKDREKRYADSFIKLHDQYSLATQAIKSRDEFLSLVSHELKTPLTVMLLNLHGTLNSIKSASLANFSVPQLMKVLRNCEQQIKWLTEIINDLLDISLITTGRMSLKLENSDLVALTREVEQSFSELLKKEKIKLKINASSPVSGRWDKVRIKQMITNILSNAIKYGEGKPINIQISGNGSHGKLIIQDQGVGIDPREQKIIFDLFKRAPDQEKYQKGLGVGLFITSQIVKMHGGRINVASIPKKGSTFTIELPFNKH